MISSIAVTGCYNIGVSETKKIKVEDNVLSVEKDIPFIRYRFDTYGENEYNYIKSMKNKFNYSTHLAEINLNENSRDVLEKLINDVGNIVKFIYFNVTDEEVANKSLSANTMQLLASIADLKVDRFIIKDKTTTLDMISTNAFIKQLSTAFRIKKDDVGVCSSPLSFQGLACLTAVKARELMSIYSPIADVALPSSNHQNMNTCGCIRYFLVNEDLPAPAGGKATQKKEKSETGEAKQTAKKKTSSIVFGAFNL